MKKIRALDIITISIALSMLGGCSSKADSLNTAKSQTEAEVIAKPTFKFLNYLQPTDINYEMYKVPVKVKGIYVSSSRAGIKKYLDELINLCNTTEVNAMVIDVKTDDGFITFENEIPVADEMGVTKNHISNIRGLINTLNENNIYSIARVVAFKDNGALEKRPDLYIKNKDGTIWRDGSKLKSGWLNPYNKESWKYIIDIAKGAAEIGFKEIQFDYFRFDTNGRLKDADFGDTEGKSRIQIITEFAEYAMKELKPYGVVVSADVYGTIINSDIDAEIVGQDYTELSKVLDVICPMVYPSHYANGSMDIANPDVQPYDTIYRALSLSNKRLESIPEGDHKAEVRPWLQDFTATWVKPHITYGAKERLAQIQATYDVGLSEWILWDASVNYDPEGFLPEDNLK